jgi:signal transduction histidine kinase
MKILIVDDSPGHLKLLRTVLESAHYQVIEAVDGVQALVVLASETIDAVISDILMPRMDGYRLCYEVRRNERWRALPFIFYTASYTSPSDQRLSYQVGGDRCLRKPAPAQEILAALNETAHSATRTPPQAGPLSELDMMKEYNERLVSKLESKNEELSEAKKKLQETNRRLEQTAAELQKANDDLELRVRQRTAELQAANEQLEAFSSSVSHDLRAPLRHIANFSDMVLINCAPQWDEKNVRHLHAIHNSAERLSGLIEAMLELSHVSSVRFDRQTVNLSALADEVFDELQQREPERRVQIQVAPGLTAAGDQRLLRIALMNLLGNAWKFTSKEPGGRIEFGKTEKGRERAFFVRDNGAGFEMAFVNKLFTAFQRLHRQDDFEGSGIGLTTVKRIIERHGGKVWAEGMARQGASFYFTLGETHAYEGTDRR